MNNKLNSNGYSRRDFLSKSLLTTALAGTWLSGSGLKAIADNSNSPAEYIAPSLSNPESFSFIIIPDTQSYVKFGRNQGICNLITAWIAENIKKLNILTALHTGDLVEQNGIQPEDLTEKNKSHVDQSSAQQWGAISGAFSRLDGKLPYIVCTGNHDYGVHSAENRSTQFPTYFPKNRNSAWTNILVECCKNRDGVRTLENAAYAFKAPQGKDILVLSLEFAPSDPVLAWAKELTSRQEYQNHFVILLTHSYLNSLANGQKRIKKEGYKVKDANYGEAIWEKLIYPSSNIRMVICGHIAGTDNPRQNVGFRQDKNQAGKTVSQMLFDAQTLGGGWHGNGGDGWIRILEFSPEFTKVSVKTFSPLFAISPSTRHLAWDLAEYNQFEFNID